MAGIEGLHHVTAIGPRHFLTSSSAGCSPRATNGLLADCRFFPAGNTGTLLREANFDTKTVFPCVRYRTMATP